MAIRDEILEELLKEYKNPEDLIGKDGILKDLTKRLIEKAMESELTHHLGYDKHSSAGIKSGNSRNGTSSKTIKGDFGELPIEVPRDRNGDFNPQIIPKHQRRFNGFDDKIISMYARGMEMAQAFQPIPSGKQVRALIQPFLASSILSRTTKPPRE